MTADVSPGSITRRVLDAYQACPPSFDHFRADLDAAEPTDGDLWFRLGALADGSPRAMDRAALQLAEEVNATIAAYESFVSSEGLSAKHTAQALVLDAVMRASRYPTPDADYRAGWLSASELPVHDGRTGRATSEADDHFAKAAQMSAAWRRGFTDMILYAAQNTEADAPAGQALIGSLQALVGTSDLSSPWADTRDTELWENQERRAALIGQHTRFSRPLDETIPADQVSIGSAVRVDHPNGGHQVGTVLAHPDPTNSIYLVKVPGNRPRLTAARPAMPFPRIQLECGDVASALDAERRLVETAALAKAQYEMVGGVRSETSADLEELTRVLAHWSQCAPADLARCHEAGVTRRAAALRRLVHAEPRLLRPGNLFRPRPAPRTPARILFDPLEIQAARQGGQPRRPGADLGMFLAEQTHARFPADARPRRQIQMLTHAATEFVDAYRRATGAPKAPGPLPVAGRLADVAILAHMTGRLLGMRIAPPTAAIVKSTSSPAAPEADMVMELAAAAEALLATYRQNPFDRGAVLSALVDSIERTANVLNIDLTAAVDAKVAASGISDLLERAAPLPAAGPAKGNGRIAAGDFPSSVPSALTAPAPPLGQPARSTGTGIGRPHPPSP